MLDRLLARHPVSSRTIAVLHRLDGLTLDQVGEVVGLDERPRAETEALGRRLRDDAGLRARLSALERSDAEIRRRYPPAWLAGWLFGRGSAPRR